MKKVNLTKKGLSELITFNRLKGGRQQKLFLLICTLIFMVSSGFIFSAFEKGTEEVKSNSQEQNQNIEEKDGIYRAPIGFCFSFEPYRKIAVRPRDNMPCGCEACFGICNFTITKLSYSRDFSKYNGIVDFSFRDNTCVFHILANYSHSEREFGIDEPIFIPVTEFSDEVSRTHRIKEGIYITPGVYNYTSKNRTIGVTNDIQRQSYGEVRVNFTIK
ncbi:hypothetical protein LJC25_01460 [Bacteroidales bacterium OttesenSCG-928-K03]|nr:hypothetical protein [Odoribacter sp. OttesenSCG-928-L07]MDL2239260.1 hypothetical protein [Bacteroidales bacterium OttesenSCG-928-L14]MDL2240399.1 hypothetical protein [Bacteroidales bacterium OttesenSCG-928-K22]MDL2242374.1 hypothetical protein [Bacteroidales bacterium OttesenSCG-928-K03]